MKKRYWVEVLGSEGWFQVGPRFWFRRSAEHEMRLWRAMQSQITGMHPILRVHDRKRNMEVR